MNANSVNRALGALEKSGVDVKSETGNSDSTMNPTDKKSRRKSLANVLKVTLYILFKICHICTVVILKAIWLK